MSSTDGAAQQESFNALLRRVQERLTLPWLGTTASIGVYSIVLAIASQDEAREVPAGLHYAFMAAGALLTAGALVVPPRLLSDAKIAARMREQPEASEVAKHLHLSHADYVNVLTMGKVEQRLVGLTRAFVAPYFVALGLSEAVAMVGFVSGLRADSVVAAAPYFFVSFVLHAVHYPRLSRLIDRGRKLDQPDAELQELSRTLDDLQDGIAPRPRASRVTPEATMTAPRRTPRTPGPPRTKS